MAEVKISIADVRAMPVEYRYCARGCRAMCVRHGFNVDTFLNEGIPVSEVSHIDDAMLRVLIEVATRRQECQENQAAG